MDKLKELVKDASETFDNTAISYDVKLIYISGYLQLAVDRGEITEDEFAKWSLDIEKVKGRKAFHPYVTS